MKPTNTPVLLLVLSALALGAPTARADEDLIPPKVLVRHFPEGLFCPLPISISFVTPATDVVVHFDALEFADDNGTPKWTQQLIDDVSIAPTSVVAAHFGPAPDGQPRQSCYVDDPDNFPVNYFYFNAPGVTPTYLELFDTDPTARGWDMTHGAYFDNTRSGSRDAVGDTDTSGGALGLGDGTSPPAPNVTKSTSVHIEGLSIGQSYDLGAWWYAGFARFPHDVTYLTISITTTGGTPVARKSWGGLKSKYR
ncbi:MAG TPA: hypothetical protein VMJ70_10815 [Candidatus Sulfotelmatobacter sp.]|nr:hypothetical protein [Candidatus Sulfotelmatobacter sp.]